MQPYFAEQFYNPSASYLVGRAVRDAVEAARGKVASLLAVRPSEVIFTAGASESIALALRGVLDAHAGAKLVTTVIEHPAILRLGARYPVETVGVKKDGRVDEAKLIAAIDDQTAIVSVGLVNNELGTVQPLRDIAAALETIRRDRQTRGIDRPLLLHSDASQATGHLDLRPHRLGVDLLTLNAAKCYGPRQAGVLYVRTGVSLVPLVDGGGQERGLRGGSENVPAIVGSAVAFALADTERREESQRLAELKKAALKQLEAAIEDLTVSGSVAHSAPHILNVSIPGVDGERLLMEADEKGVMIATGSACAANHQTASHVLVALGLTPEQIDGSVRLSFGRATTREELDRALNVLIELIAAQRGRR